MIHLKDAVLWYHLKEEGVFSHRLMSCSFIFFLDTSAIVDDINHTGQVGTQLYMSPEQVVQFETINDILKTLRTSINLIFIFNYPPKKLRGLMYNSWLMVVLLLCWTDTVLDIHFEHAELVKDFRIDLEEHSHQTVICQNFPASPLISHVLAMET